MECLILGSGTILQKDYLKNCSGYLIDRCLLVDCGPGIWQAAGRAGLKPAELNTILLTHLHVDHVSDLLPLLLARFLSLKDRRKEMRICGPVGLRGWFRSLGKFSGTWLRDLHIRLIEVTGPFSLNGYTVEAALTGHTDNSLCYRITAPDRKVLFYSGDSDYNKVLIEQARHADVCILEASNTAETKINGHLTPALAGRVAREADVRHLVLTHMYPEVETIDAVLEAGGFFEGTISLARDGTILKF
jgi:ribonuclease BN (tRNA processing enzyme)